jgi:hypothetical protein
VGKRRADWRRVKRHRTYTVEDAAETLGVHKHTIRNWLKSGKLLPIDAKRPLLILGEALSEFSVERRRRAKRKCGLGQFYCLPCRSPQTPAANFAEYRPISEAAGNLRAICPACEHFMHRSVSRSGLAEWQRHLEIVFPRGEGQLI